MSSEVVPPSQAPADATAEGAAANVGGSSESETGAPGGQATYLKYIKRPYKPPPTPTKEMEEAPVGGESAPAGPDVLLRRLSSKVGLGTSDAGLARESSRHSLGRRASFTSSVGKKSAARRSIEQSLTGTVARPSAGAAKGKCLVVYCNQPRLGGRIVYCAAHWKLLTDKEEGNAFRSGTSKLFIAAHVYDKSNTEEEAMTFEEPTLAEGEELSGPYVQRPDVNIDSRQLRAICSGLGITREDVDSIVHFCFFGKLTVAAREVMCEALSLHAAQRYDHRSGRNSRKEEPVVGAVESKPDVAGGAQGPAQSPAAGPAPAPIVAPHDGEGIGPAAAAGTAADGSLVGARRSFSRSFADSVGNAAVVAGSVEAPGGAWPPGARLSEADARSLAAEVEAEILGGQTSDVQDIDDAFNAGAAMEQPRARTRQPSASFAAMPSSTAMMTARRTSAISSTTAEARTGRHSIAEQNGARFQPLARRESFQLRRRSSEDTGQVMSAVEGAESATASAEIEFSATEMATGVVHEDSSVADNAYTEPAQPGLYICGLSQESIKEDYFAVADHAPLSKARSAHCLVLPSGTGSKRHRHSMASAAKGGQGQRRRKTVAGRERGASMAVRSLSGRHVAGAEQVAQPRNVLSLTAPAAAYEDASELQFGSLPTHLRSPAVGLTRRSGRPLKARREDFSTPLSDSDSEADAEAKARVAVARKKRDNAALLGLLQAESSRDLHEDVSLNARSWKTREEPHVRGSDLAQQMASEQPVGAGTAPEATDAAAVEEAIYGVRVPLPAPLGVLSSSAAATRVTAQISGLMSASSAADGADGATTTMRRRASQRWGSSGLLSQLAPVAVDTTAHGTGTREVSADGSVGGAAFGVGDDSAQEPPENAAPGARSPGRPGAAPAVFGPQEAVAAFSQVLLSRPGDAGALSDVAVSMMRAGAFGRAVEYLTQAIAKPEGGSLLMHCLLARAHVGAGNIEASHAVLKAGVATYSATADVSQRAEALTLRGISYVLMRDNSSGIQCFNAALAISPACYAAKCFACAALTSAGAVADGVLRMRQLCDLPNLAPQDAVVVSKCLLRVAQCATVLGSDDENVLDLVTGALAGTLACFNEKHDAAPQESVYRLLHRRDSGGVGAGMAAAEASTPAVRHLKSDLKGLLREVAAVQLYKRSIGDPDAPDAGDDLDETIRLLLRVTERAGSTAMPVSHYFLSLALSQRGDHEAALDHYYAALRYGWPEKCDDGDSASLFAVWTELWFAMVRNDVGAMIV